MIVIVLDFSYFNRKEYHQIVHLRFKQCKDKNEIVEEIEKCNTNVIKRENVVAVTHTHTGILDIDKKMINL